MQLYIDKIPSAIGQILLVADDTSLVSLDYGDYEGRMRKLLKSRYGAVELQPTANPSGFSDALRKYLAGDLTSLDAIPVRTGGTPFQQEVWRALRTIPAGSVWTYKQLAEKVGRPKAYRAVGMTNSLNPLAIVLPCHRVVGSNASLTGYAGGLERKHWLLQHEQAAQVR